MLEDRFVQNMAANMLFARPFHLQGGERLLDELALLSEHITAHLEAR